MTDFSHSTPLVDTGQYSKAMIPLRVEGDNPAEASQDSFAQVSVQTIVDAASNPVSETAISAKQSAAIAVAAGAVAAAFAASIGSLSTALSVGGALPFTVSGVSGGAGTGAGGAPGEYLLIPTGGPLGIRIYGTVGADGKASGGYRIASGGISVSSGVPTLAWPASAGFTSAPTPPVAAVSAVTAGTIFEAPTSDNAKMALWQNAGGALAPVTDSDGVQFTRYLATGLDAIALSLKAEIGSDLSDVTSASVGDLFTAGSLSSNDNIYMSRPSPYAGFLGSVSIGINGGGTGNLMVFAPVGDGTYRVAFVQAVTATGGANSWLIPDSPYLPSGFRIGYQRLTGGTPYYNSGGYVLPYIPVGSVAAVGDITPTPAVTTITIAVQYALTYAPLPLTAQIAANTASATLNTASITALLSAAYPNAMTMGDAAAATFTASLSYYWGTVPFSAGGVLRQVRVQTVTGGTGRIVAARITGGSITVLKSWIVNTTGGTVDTFGASVLGTYFVPVNVSIFYAPITSGGLRYGRGSNSYRIPSGSSVADGSVVAFTTQPGATVSIDATIGYAASGAVSARPADKSLIIERQTFAGATASGSWSLAGWSWSSGLTATGAGWTQQAIFAQPSVIANKTARAKIKLSATTDQVGIVYNCVALFPSTTGSYGGSGVIINGPGNTLDIYALDGAQSATLAESVALPSGFIVAGETYIVETKKAGLLMSAKVTRSLTQQSVSWSWDYNQTSDTRNLVRFFGAPGVVNLGGTPTVTEFDYSAASRPQPWAVLIGDSIGENSAVGVGTTNWPTGWVYQLDAARNRGDVVIAARGGDTTTGVISRMATDISIWAARYVVLAIGTNDASQSTWRANMAAIIAAVEAAGAIPVLTTYIPRTGITGKQSKLTAMNADVMGQYFGPYDYIDFASAVSVNHDCVTIDSSLYSDGTTHPNVAGQAAMFAQVQADTPYLFD